MCCVVRHCSRENVDRTTDEQEFENEVLAEIVELEAETEEDYQRKLAQYRKQLEEWKIWRRKQVLLLYEQQLVSQLNVMHITKKLKF